MADSYSSAREFGGIDEQGEGDTFAVAAVAAASQARDVIEGPGLGDARAFGGCVDADGLHVPLTPTRGSDE